MDKTIEISDDIIREAQEATGETDERAAIERAVRSYVSTKKAKTPLEGMLELAGKDLIRDDYDYKALRAGGQDERDR